MKSSHTKRFSKWVWIGASTLTFALLVVGSANAIVIVNSFGMIGVTRGQTARMNVGNIELPPGPCHPMVTFFDGAGNKLAEQGIIIEGGKAAFVDLNADMIDSVELRMTGRLEIRAQLSLESQDPSGSQANKRSKSLVPTLEVFDNSTGQTHALLSPGANWPCCVGH